MTIKAHAHNHLAKQYPPTWHAPKAPVLAPTYDTGWATTRCSFCGSMTPAELAGAIKAGAEVHWSDFKYGWPHKIYVDGVPNPFAGMPAVRSITYCGRPPQEEIDAGKWERYQDGYDSRTGEPKFSYRIVGEARPEPATTHGKFYTEHLQDATLEERVVIERAMGISFTFEGGQVSWKKFAEPEA